ncbi:MAG: nuclear transport factor 2 family protein [Gemmatimonadota bacterium]
MMRMTASDFRDLLSALADGWRRRDYAFVASHFADDVRYGDPTRYALHGRAALQAFFTADDDMPQSCTWHTVLFDEAQQRGAAEYTYVGTHQYHGTVLVRVESGQITHWREYQHTDERPWATFAEATMFPEQPGDE